MLAKKLCIDYIKCAKEANKGAFISAKGENKGNNSLLYAN